MLGCTGLDHHDVDLARWVHAPCYNQLDRLLFLKLVRGVRDPLTVDVRKAHAPNRALEGHVGDGERSRCGIDRQDVHRVHVVDGQSGDDDVDLMTEAVRERRAKGTVDQPGVEDALLTGSPLAPEETTRDLAGGIHPLLHVNRQRKEVSASGVRRRAGGEDRGLADRSEDRSSGLSGQTTGLEAEYLVSDLSLY